MMPRPDLLALLRDGCRAPSGDNVQPWRFRFAEDVLSIYNIPGIHNPHLDFEERGAYLAHGALIENICIAAPHYGYEAHVSLFPDGGDEHLVARLRFSAVERRDDPLYRAIDSRATNHHPFGGRSLTAEERVALEGAVAPIPQVTLRLVEDKESRHVLAEAASRAEAVILEDERIAGHFFAGMVWSEAEEREKKSGFFVQTLEFNPIQHLVFWLASKPRARRALRRLGLPRFVAREDAKLYATGAASGGVLIPDESPERYIAAGRALERLWLTATSRGLAFQPLIGMVFIAYRLETGRGTLTAVHAQYLQDALARTRSVLKAEGQIPALLFRIGEAPAPSVRTSRKEPDISFM